MWHGSETVTAFFQNNNLERALDWIFTHPEEEESDALSDMADTEPNDNTFSNANSHSDSTLSPDRDASGPRVKDGPGREYWALDNSSVFRATYNRWSACEYVKHCIFFVLFSRLWAICIHQPHGSIHNVWTLCLSHQKGGKVSCT